MAFKVDVQRLAQWEKPAQIKNTSNRHTNTHTHKHTHVGNEHIYIYMYKTERTNEQQKSNEKQELEQIFNVPNVTMYNTDSIEFGYFW